MGKAVFPRILLETKNGRFVCEPSVLRSRRTKAAKRRMKNFSHGLIRQYLRNYGVIPIAGLHLFLYLSGFFRIFLFYSFHCVN